MNSATLNGSCSIARWQVGNVIVVALILSAILSSRGAVIALSSAATMNHVGFVRHAGITVGVADKSAADVGPYVAVNVICSRFDKS
jgi:hypothetical protein